MRTARKPHSVHVNQSLTGFLWSELDLPFFFFFFTKGRNNTSPPYLVLGDLTSQAGIYFSVCHMFANQICTFSRIKESRK